MALGLERQEELHTGKATLTYSVREITGAPFGGLDAQFDFEHVSVQFPAIGFTRTGFARNYPDGRSIVGGWIGPDAEEGIGIWSAVSQSGMTGTFGVRR